MFQIILIIYLTGVTITLLGFRAYVGIHRVSSWMMVFAAFWFSLIWPVFWVILAIGATMFFLVYLESEL